MDISFDEIIAKANARKDALMDFQRAAEDLYGIQGLLYSINRRADAFLNAWARLDPEGRAMLDRRFQKCTDELRNQRHSVLSRMAMPEADTGSLTQLLSLIDGTAEDV